MRHTMRHGLRDPIDSTISPYVPYTKVMPEQFEWSGETLIHKPTGAEFSWSYPNVESDDVRVN